MSKRELIDSGTDKRYVRRNQQGGFDESDDQKIGARARQNQGQLRSG